MTQDNRVQPGHHTNPSNPNTTSSAQTKNPQPQSPQTKTSLRWRTVDIIVTVVISTLR